MLQTKCRHSKALPVETCSFCNCSFPESLVDICFEYIINHLETICDYEPFSNNLKLRTGVTLPVEICERLLNVRLNRDTRLTPCFINIFSDRQATRLKRVKLRNTDIHDEDLKVLLRHGLIELEISDSPYLGTHSLKYIAQHANSLTSLVIGNGIKMKLLDWKSENCDHLIIAPHLQRLCLKNFYMVQPELYEQFFKPLDSLTHLDLSNCSDLANLYFIEHLTNLTSLVLYNVDKIERMVPTICKLRNLRHLDISQSRDDRGKYDKPNQLLSMLVESLPKLISLDISGTNLAGRGVAEVYVNETAGQHASDIPGLSSRVNNPLQFLGLYETQHDACLRHDIPAKLVSTI